MIDYACGIDSRLSNPLPEPQTSAYVKCGAGLRFWTKKKCVISEIQGIEFLNSIPDSNLEFRRQVGEKEDIYRPLGTITLQTNNCDELCEIIDKINKTFKVLDENGDDVTIKYTDFENLKRIYKEGLEGR